MAGLAELTPLPSNKWLTLPDDLAKKALGYLDLPDLGATSRTCRGWSGLATSRLADLHRNKWVTLPGDLAKEALGYLDLPDLGATSRTCHQLSNFATRRLADLHHKWHTPQIELLQSCVDPHASLGAASVEGIPVSNERGRRTFRSYVDDDAKKIVDIATHVLGPYRVEEIVENRDPRSFLVLGQLYGEVLDVFNCSSISLWSPEREYLKEISDFPAEDIARKISPPLDQVGRKWEVSGMSLQNVLSESITPYFQPGIGGRVLRMIPSQIKAYSGHLEWLNLSGNALSMSERDVESLCSLPNLRRLNLSDNALRQIPPSFSRLTHLTDLDLSSNQLRDLPPLHEMDRLEQLDLHSNHFVNIPSTIQHLPHLRFLNLSDNPIESGELTSLMILFAILRKVGVQVVVNRNLIQDPLELIALQGAIESWGMDLQITPFDLDSEVFEVHPRSLLLSV